MPDVQTPTSPAGATPLPCALDQLLAATVHQAWTLAGEDPAVFASMVDALAARNPRYFARGIHRQVEGLSRANPEWLLSAVVERAIAVTADRFANLDSATLQHATVLEAWRQCDEDAGLFNAAIEGHILPHLSMRPHSRTCDFSYLVSTMPDLPLSSAVEAAVGLSIADLGSLTVSQAWLLSGEHESSFSALVDGVFVQIVKDRNIAVSDRDLALNVVREAVGKLARVDGDQRLTDVIERAIRSSLYHEPVSSELVKAWNRERTPGKRHALCHAPSTSLYFGRDGHVCACCYSRTNPLGHYPEQSIAEIWSGKRIHALRKEISQNILPMGCETCAEQLHARNFKGLLAGNFDRFAPFSVEAGLSQLKSLVSGAPSEPWPRQMEFELSNKCNLECAMCSGLFSSSIRANREGKPPLPQVYDSAFVEQLKPFIPHLKQAKFLGGEPFLIDLYYEIWELFIASNPACEIQITTNATVFTAKVKRILERLNCQIIISFDSVHKATYEAIRRNATFERTLENLETFSAINRKQGKWLTLAVCPMALNARQIPDIVDFANARGMRVFFNTVTFPMEASLKFLPVPEQTGLASLYRAALKRGGNEVESANYLALEGLSRQVESWSQQPRTAGNPFPIVAQLLIFFVA